VDLVLLTTPTTTRERAVRIAEATEGFLYLVSVTGVTGVRTSVASRVEELVRRNHLLPSPASLNRGGHGGVPVPRQCHGRHGRAHLRSVALTLTLTLTLTQDDSPNPPKLSTR
jgi:hypothetical protein